MNKIIVIGGDRLECLLRSPQRKPAVRVILLEKNEKLGKKTFHYRKGTMQYYQCRRYG